MEIHPDEEQDEQPQDEYAPEHDSSFSTTLTSTVSDQGMLAVAYLLEHHASLQSLSIIQCPDFLCPQQPVASIRRLTRAMGASRTLQRLALEGCGVCDETVEYLCEDALLPRNSSLRHLDLLSNDLGFVGHEILNSYLPRLRHLQTLALEASTMEHASDFVRALQGNTSLTQVRVMDTPEMNISAAVDGITWRNELWQRTQRLLRGRHATSTNNNDNADEATTTTSDAVWGQALARLAADPQGLSSLFQIVRTKKWAPERLHCSAEPSLSASFTNTNTASPASSLLRPGKRRRLSR